MTNEWKELYDIAYIQGNNVAKKLYEGAGFIQTDIVDEGETHEVNMILEVE